MTTTKEELIRIKNNSVGKDGVQISTLMLHCICDMAKDSLDCQTENARLKKALDKYSEDEITTEAATLRLLINEAITTMSHAEIFIESREKMHPTGVKLWGDLLDRMAVAVEPEQECGNESMKSIGGV
jgi:hypothetical protein